jgi:hypothetical protein
LRVLTASLILAFLYLGLTVSASAETTFVNALAAIDKDCDPLFGPEFTFFSDGDVSAGSREAIIKRATKHLAVNQPVAARFEVGGEYPTFFFSPNGWRFGIKNDNGGIEVEMLPMQVEGYEKFSSDMQDAIFVTAANEHFFPMLFSGGGHINMGLECFRHNYLLARNFIVDYFINHTELGLGVMNYDTNNAAPFPLLAKDAQDKVLDIIRAYDKAPPYDTTEFLGELSKTLRTSGDDFTVAWHPRPAYYPHDSYQVTRGKYTALNFNHCHDQDPDKERFEIRAVRAQASMDVFIRQIRLFRNRVRYLKTMNKPIAIEPKVKIKAFIDAEGEDKLKPPLNPTDALRAFYDYVTESGEKWSDHTDYLWPAWITDGTVAQFEKSKWFKMRQLSSFAKARQVAQKNATTLPRCADFLKNP